MKFLSNYKSCLKISMFLIIFLMVASCGANRKGPSQEDLLKATSYYQLAISAFTNGNVVDALQSLKEVEKYDPNHIEAKNLLGLIFLSRGMFPDAEKQFKETIAIDPTFSEAYLSMSGVYMAQSKWQEAIDVLKVPADDLMYRRKDMVYDNLGWCYSQLGQNEKAIKNARTATIENPQFCHAWYTLGRVYKKASLLKESQRALEKAVEMKHCSKFLAAYHELGIVAYSRQEYETARQAFTNCIANGEPGSQIVEECKAYYANLP